MPGAAAHAQPCALLLGDVAPLLRSTGRRTNQSPTACRRNHPSTWRCNLVTRLLGCIRKLFRPQVMRTSFSRRLIDGALPKSCPRSLRAIAEHLNVLGIGTPRGGRWAAASVARLLRQLEA